MFVVNHAIYDNRIGFDSLDFKQPVADMFDLFNFSYQMRDIEPCIIGDGVVQGRLYENAMIDLRVLVATYDSDDYSHGHVIGSFPSQRLSKQFVSLLPDTLSTVPIVQPQLKYRRPLEEHDLCTFVRPFEGRLTREVNDSLFFSYLDLLSQRGWAVYQRPNSLFAKFAQLDRRDFSLEKKARYLFTQSAPVRQLELSKMYYLLPDTLVPFEQALVERVEQHEDNYPNLDGRLIEGFRLFANSASVHFSEGEYQPIPHKVFFDILRSLKDISIDFGNNGNQLIKV